VVPTGKHCCHLDRPLVVVELPIEHIVHPLRRKALKLGEVRVVAAYERPEFADLAELQPEPERGRSVFLDQASQVEVDGSQDIGVVSRGFILHFEPDRGPGWYL
jgi:hypothetical protein